MKEITITREQYNEAVNTANDKFISSDKERVLDPTATLMMKLQNMIFGRLIAEVLFGDEKEEN